MKTRKIFIKPFKMVCDCYDRGFVMKRDVTLREARYILKRLLGINIYTKEDLDDTGEYSSYNEDLLTDINNWLRGDVSDGYILENYAGDCSDDPIGIWNAFKIAQYLLKKNII